MAYNIPLTGQIRLGRDFNRMKYPLATSHTQQISFNEKFVREQHKGVLRYGSSTGNNALNGIGYNAISPINPASGSERRLYYYRGSVQGHPQTETDLFASSSPYSDGATWYWYKAGNVLNSTFVRTTAYQTAVSSGSGTGGGINVGNKVLHSQLKYSSGTSNGAVANILYLGYLEAGTYILQGMTIQRGGSNQWLVRGYSQASLGGSSTDYKLTGMNCSGWQFNYLDGNTGSRFTVNSTYPYCIMILQTNTNLLSAGNPTGSTNTYWLNGAHPNLNTVSTPQSTINSNPQYMVEPHVTRLS